MLEDMRVRPLPVVLSPAVVQFLDGVTLPTHRAILTPCDAASLRISEAVRLTVSAIDRQRMVLRIPPGQGQRDRDVMLSPTLQEILRAWWQVHRPAHWLFPGGTRPPQTTAATRGERSTPPCWPAPCRRHDQVPPTNTWTGHTEATPDTVLHRSPRSNAHRRAPGQRFSPLHF